MKIGIPRSLFFYHFSDIWINFFKYLKMEVIISPETNKEILELELKFILESIA